jgi:D-alanyl-D-alanine carboxypeptidase/D-alanyl-D-alanine-endopeptidase (penicillin-binding protein 4)
MGNRLRIWGVTFTLTWGCWASEGRAAEALPLAVQVALKQAQVADVALGVVVQALDESSPRLAWRADQAMNPASVLKLVTSMAALDRLGPAWQWQTPVWLNGTINDAGLLDGDLVIQGSGDPRLSTERLWGLLRRLQGQGLREISGRLVLDRSAFAPSSNTPGDFDGEPWRVGNALPDALLVNAKAISYTIRPEGLVARIRAEPALDAPASVPLLPGACGDWRSSLKLQWAPGERIRFTGGYPSACGEQTWTLADPDPTSYAARLFAQLAAEQGLRWKGEAVEAPAPTTAPTLLFAGPSLAEALRDMNKYSSNLMAQQVLLSAARASGVAAPVSAEAAAAWLLQWLQAHVGETPPVKLVNGSGLARETRVSAAQLAALLRRGWAQGWMPELLASLPLAGQDGTLKNQPGRFGAAAGQAHLKTGSLRDTVALAGIVQAASGRRYVLVAMINHREAQSARGVLEALVRWTAQDAPAARPVAPESPPAASAAHSRHAIRHSPERPPAPPASAPH